MINSDFPLRGHFSFALRLSKEKILVEYDGLNWWKGNADMVHLTFKGKSVSKTGYKSHFYNAFQMEICNLTPFEFAKLLAKNLILEQTKQNIRFQKNTVANNSQLILF